MPRKSLDNEEKAWYTSRKGVQSLQSGIALRLLSMPSEARCQVNRGINAIGQRLTLTQVLFIRYFHYIFCPFFKEGHTSLKTRERRQDLMDKIIPNVAQDATPKNSINTAKINLAIKINALFANINLHPMLIKKRASSQISFLPQMRQVCIFLSR